jgi:hypothetical protein
MIGIDTKFEKEMLQIQFVTLLKVYFCISISELEPGLEPRGIAAPAPLK